MVRAISDEVRDAAVQLTGPCQTRSIGETP